MSNPESKPEHPGEDAAADTDSVQPQPQDDTDLDAGESGAADSVADTAADAAAAGDGDEPGRDIPLSLEAQLAERTEDLQRVTAEYANFRRRTAREREALVAHTKSSVVTDFLPVVDDLDLAASHGDLSGPLKAISDKLSATFDKLGVVRFAAPGDEFDPEIHEAVQDLSSGDEKVIGTVLRPGYMIGERLVRTAMVIIADPLEPSGD